MNVTSVLLIAQILVSVLLVGSVLLQAQGSGLGGTWGGGGESYHTKRGVEKVIFSFTIALAIAFFFLSLLTVVIG